ncbi:MAG: hypothetical protein RIK87_02170 [Fuerstiella sp.]
MPRNITAAMLLTVFSITTLSGFTANAKDADTGITPDDIAGQWHGSRGDIAITLSWDGKREHLKLRQSYSNPGRGVAAALVPLQNKETGCIDLRLDSYSRSEGRQSAIIATIKRDSSGTLRLSVLARVKKLDTNVRVVKDVPLQPVDRSSEVDIFDSVQQNSDYRVSLLSVTKGVAFLDSQKLVSDGGRTPGNNVVPWMRVATVIEKLTDKEEPWGFKAEGADGTELPGKLRIETNGHIHTSRISGLAEMDLHYPPLRHAIFPTESPKGASPKSKVYLFTLSGKIQQSETVTFRFWFGNGADRRELVFQGVPLP